MQSPMMVHSTAVIILVGTLLVVDALIITTIPEIQTATVDKPSTLEEPSWIMYTNETYRFRFLYPNNWFLQKGFQGRISPGDEGRVPGIDAEEIVLTLLNPTTHKSEIGFSLFFGPSTSGGGASKECVYGRTRHIKVVTQDALIKQGIDICNSDRNNVKEIFINKEGSSYFFLLVNNPHLEYVFDQIVDSFTFID